uniref:Uncharacterized protein n=1 Tax=Anguilla anguilla TaxID=7936 RepID=A0A0E9Y1V8_ANGAN
MVTSSSSKVVEVWNMPSEFLIKVAYVGCPQAVVIAVVIYSAALEFPPSIFIFVFVIAFHS